MPEKSEITNLSGLLDRIDSNAEDKGDITLGEIVEAVGRRSFGPMLLLVGVIMASPISGVPGMPTTMGIILLLIAVQLLLRKEHFWLPKWMLKRSADTSKIYRTLRHLRPVASFVDRILRPRLPLFSEGISIYVIAVVCVLVGVTMPMMELVPFSVHGAGVAMTAFGLALIARDGLVGLIAFVVTAIVYALAVYHMVT